MSHKPDSVTICGNLTIPSAEFSIDANGQVSAKMFSSFPAGKPSSLECPRCKGEGQELLFMGHVRCEVCDGMGRCSPEKAKAERERQDKDYKRYSMSGRGKGEGIE